jgi:SulP family sulfate permease
LLVGYIHGVAVVLVCGQLGKLLGVDIDATKPVGQVVDAIQELGDASGTTVLVSAVALGALLVARSFIPRLPAALIVSAATSLVDPGAWRALRRVSRFELGIARRSCRRAGRAPGARDRSRAVDPRRRAPQCAATGRGTGLGRPARALGKRGAPSLRTGYPGRIFFANARYVKGRVREALRGAADESHWVVFDAEAVSHVDTTGVEAFRELAEGLPQDGVRLVVARMKPSVYEVLVAGGVAEAIGEERFFPTVRAAVAACVDGDTTYHASPT